ncbi:hypothetical protein [Salinigranum salinum]|uniref:hypothetical protein n=1 Tax=Salinigranum salinum TaxID=1364937 RepID=UPI0012612C2D|nr:hypothetical protein [Salinigranum salinum]
MPHGPARLLFGLCLLVLASTASVPGSALPTGSDHPETTESPTLASSDSVGAARVTTDATNSLGGDDQPPANAGADRSGSDGETSTATTNGISGLLVGVAVAAILLWRRWRRSS